MDSDSDSYRSDFEEDLRIEDNERSVSPNVVDIEVYNSTKEELERITNFASELESMVFSRKFSDFTFTVSGQTFYAHKFILESRSPVFARMFLSPDNNEIIDDCDRHVFHEILEYLYIGKISGVKQYAKEILPIADRYQIESLKTVCESNIEITNKNAIDVLIMAKKCGANKLKERTIAYFTENLKDIKKEYRHNFRNLLEFHADLLWGLFFIG